MTALLKKKKIDSLKRAKNDDSWIKGAIRKLLLTINILFVLTLFFSYLATYVNPKHVILPALVGLAYPYLVIINIFFVVYWIFSRRWEFLIPLGAILIGMGVLGNYFRFPKHRDFSDDSFKVISYNVKLFNFYETKSTPSNKEILSYLKDQDADVICMQELFVDNKNINETAIKGALGDKIYSHTKFINNIGNRSYGIGTYTKYPIIRRSQIFHPKSSSLTIITDIVADGDTIRIFNNHLQSFKLKNIEHSNILEELASREKTEVKNNIANIISSLHDGFVKRAEQAIVVKEEIAKSPYPTIVLGDFNDTPISYSFHIVSKGLNDAFVKAGNGSGNSYKGAYPSNRIDYILFDNNFICEKFDKLNLKYSDHYPICAYFKKNINASNNQKKP